MCKQASLLLLLPFFLTFAVFAEDVQIAGLTFEKGYTIEWGQDYRSYSLYSPAGSRVYSVSADALGIANADFHSLAVDSTAWWRPPFIR